MDCLNNTPRSYIVSVAAVLQNIKMDINEIYICQGSFNLPPSTPGQSGYFSLQGAHNILKFTNYAQPQIIKCPVLFHYVIKTTRF